MRQALADDPNLGLSVSRLLSNNVRGALEIVNGSQPSLCLGEPVKELANFSAFMGRQHRAQQSRRWKAGTDALVPSALEEPAQ